MNMSMRTVLDFNLGKNVLQDTNCPPVKPQTFLANSTTAVCNPRQIPKYGPFISRAHWAARIILPSLFRQIHRAPTHPFGLNIYMSYLVFDELTSRSSNPRIVTLHYIALTTRHNIFGSVSFALSSRC